MNATNCLHLGPLAPVVDGLDPHGGPLPGDRQDAPSGMGVVPAPPRLLQRECHGPHLGALAPVVDGLDPYEARCPETGKTL
ncbi:hypothetical protein ACIRP7_10355 [Streptomyces sp. NPDC102270]|uniref:hypothetical protein n=1 Tax=Streptomyces sp. NPDC102270 TaxID=3366150 RepID=UPI00380A4792